MNVFYLVVPLSLDMLHDLSDKRLMEVRGLVKCAVISHNAPCTTHSKRGSLRWIPSINMKIFILGHVISYIISFNSSLKTDFKNVIIYANCITNFCINYQFTPQHQWFFNRNCKKVIYLFNYFYV